MREKVPVWRMSEIKARETPIGRMSEIKTRENPVGRMSVNKREKRMSEKQKL